MLIYRLIAYLTILISALVVAKDTLYTLRHRFLPFPQHQEQQPQNNDPEWLVRGVLLLSTDDQGDDDKAYNGKLVVDGAHSSSIDLSSFRDDGKGWYQLVLGTDDTGSRGDGSSFSEQWPMTSIKSCLLRPSDPHDLTLTVQIVDSKPISISLSTKRNSCQLSDDPMIISLSNVTANPLQVSIKTPIKPQSPTLAPPPNIDPTGNIAPPPVEKSFLQKYWLPIIGIAVFAMSQMGPDEPRGAKKE